MNRESLIFRRGRKKPSKSEWQRDQEWAREDDTQGNNHPDLGRENLEGKRKLSLGNFPVHLPLKWRLEQIPHLDLSSLNCKFESLWHLTAQAHPSLTTLGSPSFREAATQQAVPLHSFPSSSFKLPIQDLLPAFWTRVCVSKPQTTAHIISCSETLEVKQTSACLEPREHG